MFVITRSEDPAIIALFAEINNIERVVGTARVILKGRFFHRFDNKCIRPELFNQFCTAAGTVAEQC